MMNKDVSEPEVSPKNSKKKRQKFSQSHRKLFLLINPLACLAFFFFLNYLNSLLLMYLSIFIFAYYIALILEQICLCVKHRGQLLELLIVTVSVTTSFFLTPHAMNAGTWCFFKQNQGKYMTYIEEFRPQITTKYQEFDKPIDNSFKAYYISGSLLENDTMYIVFVTLSAGYAGHRGYVYFTGDYETLTTRFKDHWDSFREIYKNWYTVSES